jgi:hypothetical protein
VHFDKKWNKWKAQIQINKQKIGLGTFKTELEAAKAYNNAVLANNVQSPLNKLD